MMQRTLTPDVLANSTNTTGTLAAPAAMNAGVTAAAGAYTPLFNGRLIRVIIMQSFSAVTSAIYGCVITLSCINFTPSNIIRQGIPGAGIATAPAFPIPPVIWEVDQPVITTQGITPSIGWQSTPTTPQVLVMGLFTTNQGMSPNPSYGE